MREIIQNISVITKDFAQSAPKLTASLQATIDSIKELIKANRANFDATVRNAEQLTAELKNILVENRENFRVTVSNAKTLTNKLNAILAENRDGLKTTVDNISSASGKVEGLIDSLTEASDSMKAIMAKISKGEGTVGKLVTDEEVYNNLNDTLKGAKGMLTDVGNIGFYLGLRAERAIEWNESRAYLTLKIQPRLDSYYLLEITNDARAPDPEDGSTNDALSDILYTAMVAKRFSDITLRGGLIESSAGVAADYHMLGDRLVLTTELFNLSGYDTSAPDPQVRAFARWNFMKYLYLYGGGDELLNDEYRTFFLGGGLMFDDDTLKLALGLSRF